MYSLYNTIYIIPHTIIPPPPNEDSLFFQATFLFFSFLIIIIISIIVESQTLPKFLALWMLSLLDKGCEPDDDV